MKLASISIFGLSGLKDAASSYMVNSQSTCTVLRINRQFKCPFSDPKSFPWAVPSQLVNKTRGDATMIILGHIKNGIKSIIVMLMVRMTDVGVNREDCDDLRKRVSKLFISSEAVQQSPGTVGWVLAEATSTGVWSFPWFHPNDSILLDSAGLEGECMMSAFPIDVVFGDCWSSGDGIKFDQWTFSLFFVLVEVI